MNRKDVVLTKLSPAQTSNIFSRVLFLWFRKIVKSCVDDNLKVTDLYKCLSDDRSSKLTNTLERHWNDELIMAGIKNRNPSFLRAICKTHLCYFSYIGGIFLLQATILRPSQAVILAILINLFSEGNENNVGSLCIYGSILITLSVVCVFIENHIYLKQNKLGMQIRIASSSLIYRKILRLSKKGFEEADSGKVINLLSNDVIRFDLVFAFLPYLAVTPILVIVATIFIGYQMQVGGILGEGILIMLTLPVHIFVGNLIAKLRLKVAERTDTRVKKVSEIVSGIQVIKFYAWEVPFTKVVNDIRTKEIETITNVSYIRGIIYSSSVFVERLSLFIIVVVYVLMGSTITASKVFSVALIINILQLAISLIFPLAVNMSAETLVSIRRLQEFLLYEEKFLPAITYNTSEELRLKNIHVSWIPQTPVLKDINLYVKPGSLCAVIGPVGVGKSSLLQLFLGELIQENGSITVGGHISYADQKPWLFSSTVRHNILFGQTYNKNLYEKVINICSLEADLDILPQRDESLVGEKGISLSGGQKARINLARAIYRNADIYLLDDPLSAVDTYVGKELFENCILGYLKNKTRILVTHQLQYLHKVDHIVVLNNGTIEAQGNFSDLIKLNIDFTKLLVTSTKLETPNLITHERRDSVDMFISSISSSLSTYKSKSSKFITSLCSNKLDDFDEDSSSCNIEIYGKEKSIFLEYLKSAKNYCALISTIILLIFGQASANCADLWLTLWTTREDLNSTHMSSNVTLLEPPIISNKLTICIYSGIVLTCIILLLSAAICYYKVAMCASKNLHNAMFKTILKTPIKFFETTPSGSILNRFSRDMGIVDDILPPVLQLSLQILLQATGIAVMVSISNPYMIIIILVLFLLVNKLRICYISVANSIKHLDGITKSPVYSYINATWNGINTIRVNEMESVLRNEFDNLQDTHTSAWYLYIVSMSAFGLWLDMLSCCLLFCVVFSFILLSNYNVVNGSFAGLAISQTASLAGMLQYGVTQIAQTVSLLTSVERVIQYTKLDSEESPEENKNKSIMLWPYQGKISFHNVYLSYFKSDPPILKNLNFVIKPEEKIGIVGRTGAGKSSLISALFRLVPIDGVIIIDGIDTSTIPLNLLRSNIAIIPQEPVLFSETLRYNLDPFKQFSDDQIWRSLEEVELKDIASSLDLLVNEGGSNFSIGQRQLICLARAILRKCKILVLDEATANVDHRTDELIQKTIRDKFVHCTVLTVAHRLNTIMDSDKVMVIDSGLIVEYNHPYLLLENDKGYFYKMVMESNFAILSSIAEQSYKKRRMSL